MCGRARCTLTAADVPRACHRADGPLRTLNIHRFRPLYNASPGSDLPVVRRDDESGGGGVVLQCMKWGLIPSFTDKSEKPNYYKMFNARSESIREKASFRRLVPKSRCLVAVEGFYEWKKDGSKKQPYYVHFKDGRPLVFAALYDHWESPEGELLYTFTILTTSSSPTLEWLHDRMPVILGDKERMDMWLNDSSSKFDIVLKPYEAPDLVWYPVTPSMGKPSFDGPDCIKEIQLKTEGNNPISKFFSAKETKKETSDSKEETSPCNTSVKPEPSQCLEEHERDVYHGASSCSVGAEESKDSLAKCSSETPGTCQMKRDCEDISSDSKISINNYDGKIGSSSKIRKKGGLKTGRDNQSTLFSYFGRK